MSKPIVYERVRPTRDINHGAHVARTPAQRLAELLVWDLRASGSDTPGGEYSGRDAAGVLAHGRSMFEHYRGISRAGRPIVLEACAAAVNIRLRELKHPARAAAADLADGEPQVAQGWEERWLPAGEPVALYLNRLQCFDKAKEYVDADPLSTYGAIDAFLAENPHRGDVRGAQPVVEYLTAHSGLDAERRILLAGAYDLVAASLGVLPQQR